MFKTITRNDPLFSRFKKAEAESQPFGRRLVYNDLAEQYNQLEVEEMLVFPRSTQTFRKLKTHIEERGLMEQDYTLYPYEVYRVDTEGDPVLDPKTGKPVLEKTLAVLVRKTTTKMALT